MLVRWTVLRTILGVLLLGSTTLTYVAGRPQYSGAEDARTNVTSSILVKRDSDYHHHHHHDSVNRNGERITDRIFFPEDVKDRSDIDLHPRFGDRAPRCANGSTFCEHVDTYPSHFVEEIITKNKHYEDFFSGDDVPIEISNRVAGDLEKPICEAMQQTVYPTLGETSTGEWKYIVNLRNSRNNKHKEILQAVTVEICTGKRKFLQPDGRHIIWLHYVL
ncbi:unnamed protein product [Callosobruchus maculatus]|uniref:Spaetzle domain-containing protein n=1 Tax=Callosobruchus maculatus TaxID=64391 RepID=A0A653D8S1_CALMS|nr:unnamed protein product [Callosobruchus maculatus]